MIKTSIYTIYTCVLFSSHILHFKESLIGLRIHQRVIWQHEKKTVNKIRLFISYVICYHYKALAFPLAKLELIWVLLTPLNSTHVEKKNCLRRTTSAMNMDRTWKTKVSLNRHFFEIILDICTWHFILPNQKTLPVFKLYVTFM